MTYSIKIKNKDLSSIKSGFVGATSVYSGLLSYYSTRRNLPDSLINLSTSSVDAVVNGAPTFTEQHAVVNKDNAITFRTNPNASASRTWAVIFRPLRTSGLTYPVGSFGLSPAVNGAEYLALTGTSVIYEGISFDPSTGAFAGVLRTTSTALELNRYDLVVVRVVDQQKVDLLLPRLASTKTAATSSSLNYSASAANFRAALSASTSDNENISMFAHWNRALTDEEIAIFYAEQKEKFANVFSI